MQENYDEESPTQSEDDGFKRIRAALAKSAAPSKFAKRQQQGTNLLGVVLANKIETMRIFHKLAAFKKWHDLVYENKINEKIIMVQKFVRKYAAKIRVNLMKKHIKIKNDLYSLIEKTLKLLINKSKQKRKFNILKWLITYTNQQNQAKIKKIITIYSRLINFLLKTCFEKIKNFQTEKYQKSVLLKQKYTELIEKKSRYSENIKKSIRKLTKYQKNKSKEKIIQELKISILSINNKNFLLKLTQIVCRKLIKVSLKNIQRYTSKIKSCDLLIKFCIRNIKNKLSSIKQQKIKQKLTKNLSRNTRNGVKNQPSIRLVKTGNMKINEFIGKYKEFNKEEWQAAIKIQSMFKKYLYRKYVQRTRSNNLETELIELNLEKNSNSGNKSICTIF